MPYTLKKKQPPDWNAIKRECFSSSFFFFFLFPLVQSFSDVVSSTLLPQFPSSSSLLLLFSYFSFDLRSETAGPELRVLERLAYRVCNQRVDRHAARRRRAEEPQHFVSSSSFFFVFVSFSISTRFVCDT